MIRRILLLTILLLVTACGTADPTAQTLRTADPLATIGSVVVAAPTLALPFATSTEAPSSTSLVSSPTLEPPTATLEPPTATRELPAATLEPPMATVAATEPAATVATEPAIVPAAAGDVSDTIALSPEEAPPTAGASSNAKKAPSEPARLEIPSIALNLVPVSVGLDKKRVPIVPKHDVGWYNLSARPTQGENIVFWGHVLRWKDSPNVPAPFARMKEVKLGALIMVTTGDGKVHRYKVTQQLQVKPDQVQYILPVGHERLTLVSCIGDKVIEKGEVTKKFRLVTIAEPAS